TVIAASSLASSRGDHTIADEMREVREWIIERLVARFAVLAWIELIVLLKQVTLYFRSDIGINRVV
ncbi:MAG TPA: hypothetical protein VF783_14565, partial [Terriglobales bacterium]